MDSDLLKIALSAAVPLYVIECRQAIAAGRHYDLAEEARNYAQLIAEKGDRLMFKSKKGESAQVFNALARGLAIMSFCPGGVEFMGMRFCNVP